MSALKKAASDYRPDGSGDECREFVVAFAEPLTRLAHLLTVGSQQSMDADQQAAEALAHVRRHWRDANESGFPELVAIDALLSKLARRHGPLRRDRASVPWTAEPFAVADTLGTADAAGDIDLDLVRAGLWQAFQQLPRRQRVPLVFADPSVASPRLAGLGVPTSFVSERRQAELFDEALAHLRMALRSVHATASAADALTDDEVLAALADALRPHASEQPAPTDPYSAVLDRAAQVRRRTGYMAAVVAAAVAVVAFGVVRVSTPPKAHKSASAAQSVSPQPVPRLRQPSVPVVEPPTIVPPTNSDDRPVVDWPVRGNAADDAVLIAQVKSDFLVAHPDAVGVVQVLLAQDTPAFRIAYLTANSPKGVLQSWFYGTPGSDNLVEGASSYGGSLVANATVLASAVVDTHNQTELVVMAPPSTTDMQLADFDFRTPAPTDAGIHPLAFADGVATKPIDADSADGLVLDVKVGTAAFTMPQLPTVVLGPVVIRPGAATVPVVERGQADQVLLLKALEVAAIWEEQAPTAPVGSPVVLWGGTDAAGTRLVVVRAQTQTFALVVLEWSGDLPTVHGELLVNSATPEVPVAFTYRAIDGIRVGVIAPPGVTKATLTFEGKKTVSAVDATGFASFRASASTGSVAAARDVDPDGAGGLDIAGEVTLSDAAGHVVALVPFPPHV